MNIKEYLEMSMHIEECSWRMNSLHIIEMKALEIIDT